MTRDDSLFENLADTLHDLRNSIPSDQDQAIRYARECRELAAATKRMLAGFSYGTNSDVERAFRSLLKDLHAQFAELDTHFTNAREDIEAEEIEGRLWNKHIDGLRDLHGTGRI